MHFGEGNQFTPDRTPDGAVSADKDEETLARCLLRDLLDPANAPPTPTPAVSGHGEGRDWIVPPMRRLLCLTGDFTSKASEAEFLEAVRFVKRLRSPSPQGLGLDASEVFVCPGNHDLDYNATTTALRWGRYAGVLLNGIYPGKFEAENAARFGGVTVCREAGVLVLSLNSEMLVHNEPKNKTRGDLTAEQLIWAKSELDKFPEAERRSWIKVAMVHHHPILLPSLAEPDRGYDAINGAQHLLTLLHKYGFHVLLHGHKHYPHTFHESVRNAFERTDEHALVIVAGGSCGSRGLPPKKKATQTYNRIRIHWDAEQGSTRVQVETRGLRKEDSHGSDLLPPEWHWETLAIDDRVSLLGGRSRQIRSSALRYVDSPEKGNAYHGPRNNEYQRNRYNFPVAELRPSLLPRQTNEVHLRIVQHKPSGLTTSPMNDPTHVTWSAGHMFPMVTINRAEDPEFNAVFAYYGAALMRAELFFADGHQCNVFIYAPMLPAEAAAPGPGAPSVSSIT
jgi:3',5'-cyclic AMP phosphodiesterase CpdA